MKANAVHGLLLAIFALTLTIGCYSYRGKVKVGERYYLPATVTDVDYVEPRRPSGQTTFIYTFKTRSYGHTYTYRAVHGPNASTLDKIGKKVILKMVRIEDGSSVVAEMEFLP